MPILTLRINFRILSPPSPPRVKKLSFQIEPGRVRPQCGQTCSDLLTSRLQLGQSSEFRLVDGFIMKISMYEAEVMGIQPVRISFSQHNEIPYKFKDHQCSSRQIGAKPRISRPSRHLYLAGTKK
jgi:hypothetical protein